MPLLTLSQSTLGLPPFGNISGDPRLSTDLQQERLEQ
jgi:hypothetical protein